MQLDRFRRPGHLIIRLARIMNRRGEERFQALGLAIAQLPVLFFLGDGKTCTQSELARLAQIEQPTMAQLLGRMERDGLILRNDNPADRRSALISLTPEALKKIPHADAALLEGNAEALQGFSEQEVAKLCQMLFRIIRNLDPQAADFYDSLP